MRISVLLASAAVVAASLGFGPASAQTAALNADLGHSQAEFAIKHLVFSTVRGRIKFTSLSVVPASDTSIPVSVDASLDPATIDSGNDSRDKDLRSNNFFDVAAYPAITFKSTKIAGADPKNFTIAGDLTMHGVTKAVTFDAHFLGDVADQRGNRRFIYSATTKVDRRDFGMNWAGQTPGGSLVAGDEVDLTVNVEVVKPAP